MRTLLYLILWQLNIYHAANRTFSPFSTYALSEYSGFEFKYLRSVTSNSTQATQIAKIPSIKACRCFSGSPYRGGK